MNLLTQQTRLISIANGTLMAQKRLTGIGLGCAQWFHCLAFVFGVTDGSGVVAIAGQNPALYKHLVEAWEEYRSA